MLTGLSLQSLDADRSGANLIQALLPGMALCVLGAYIGTHLLFQMAYLLVLIIIQVVRSFL